QLRQPAFQLRSWILKRPVFDGHGMDDNRPVRGPGRLARDKTHPFLAREQPVVLAKPAAPNAAMRSKVSFFIGMSDPCQPVSARVWRDNLYSFYCKSHGLQQTLRGEGGVFAHPLTTLARSSLAIHHHRIVFG